MFLVEFIGIGNIAWNKVPACNLITLTRFILYYVKKSLI